MKRQRFKYRKEAVNFLLALTFIIMLFAPVAPALAAAAEGNWMVECVTLRVTARTLRILADGT